MISLYFLLLALLNGTAAFAPTLHPVSTTSVTSRRQTWLRYKSNQDPTTPFSTPLEVGDTTTKPTIKQPLLNVPMQQLRLPKFAIGQGPVTLPLKIQGQGPFRFMIDSGLTTAIIAPQLQDMIQTGPEKKSRLVQGLGAGGKASQPQPIVEIDGVSLWDGVNPDIPLPTIQAMVMGDFCQMTMDPQRPVAGMIGMHVLFTHFDVDLDFVGKRIRLWAPGTAAAEAKRLNMVEIPAVVINESLVLGTRLTGKSANDKKKEMAVGAAQQPFLGIIDTGATFSAVNWEAAKLMGLPPKSKRLEYNPVTNPQVLATGLDGKSLRLPTKKLQFTYCGNVIENGKSIVGFEAPPLHWKPWKPVMAAVGDLPVFELLLGDSEKEPFVGPAGIVGMDVLSQRRVIFEAPTSPEQRSRRLFMSPE